MLSIVLNSPFSVFLRSESSEHNGVDLSWVCPTPVVDIGPASSLQKETPKNDVVRIGEDESDSMASKSTSKETLR